MKTIIGTAIRFAAYSAIFWIVWHHAHWSVALVLSALTVQGELIGFVLLSHGRLIRKEFPVNQ